MKMLGRLIKYASCGAYGTRYRGFIWILSGFTTSLSIKVGPCVSRRADASAQNWPQHLKYRSFANTLTSKALRKICACKFCRWSAPRHQQLRFRQGMPALKLGDVLVGATGLRWRKQMSSRSGF